MNPAAKRSLCLFLGASMALGLGSKNSSAFASTNDFTRYSARAWHHEDGLPHQTVQTIFQSRDGYLWIGTRQGLARFDGVRFTVIQPDDVRESRNHSVTALCETSDGSLWIGTEGAGIVRSSSSQLQANSFPGNFTNEVARVFYESADRSLWIGTTNGLLQFKNGEGKRFGVPEGLTDSVVRAVCDDGQGGLWIATGNGLSHWENGRIVEEPAVRGVIYGSLRALCLDRQGNLWIGSNSGLTRLKNGQLTHFTTKDGLAANIVSALHEDREGQLWIGTYGGLNRMRTGVLLTELTPDGDAYDVVSALCEDREGNLWVGTKDGLTRLNARQFTTFTKQHGLTHNNVMSVFEDQSGAIWMGTWGGGVCRMQNEKPNPSPPVIIRHKTANGFSPDLILALREDVAGTLWVGLDYGGGLYGFRENEIQQFGPAEGLMDPAVRVIYEHPARPGVLWIGTSGALYRLRDGGLTRYTTNAGLAGNIVRAITEDHAGTLWIGTQDGLTCLRERFTSFTTRDGLSHNAVLSLYEDSAHTLWIGTAGGLCRIKNEKFKIKNSEADGAADGKAKVADGSDQKSKIKNQKFSFTSYTTRQGLFHDEIFEILEDDSGFLWMSCPNGVFRVRRKDFDDVDFGKMKSVVCTAYGKADGLASALCNGVAKPAAWKAKDGRLWFATTKGVAVVSPASNVKRNEMVPPVVVEGVIADKMPFPNRHVEKEKRRKEEKEKGRKGEEGNSPFPLFSFSPLLIPAGRGELEFHYTALSFREPEKNRFKYQLQGVDPNWVEADTRRVAYYNNIKPGAYTFRVIGCNHDGVWNALGANVKFTLLPHFWQTWWFKLLLGLAGAGLLGFAYHVRVSRIRELEQLRFRIAGDLHDDVGASLTKIAMLSEIAHRAPSDPARHESAVKEIAATNRHVIRSIQEIIWTIKPKNDTLDKLVSFMLRYAQDYFQDTGIRCRLDAPEELPNEILPTEVRHDLFLVFKEALHNIAKHSQASEVLIRILVGKKTFTMIVSDNGRGFPSDKRDSSGNGLASMKQVLRCFRWN